MRRQCAHRAPIGALCVPTGPHRAPFAQSSHRGFMRRAELHAKAVCAYSSELYPKGALLLVVLRLNVPVNNFSVMSGRSHRFLGN